MDLGKIALGHSDSSMDQNDSFIDSSGGSSGARGGDCVQEHLQGTGEKHFDHSDDESGPEQQDVRQHVAQKVSRDGSSGIVIRSLEELTDAIKLGNLSQVKGIELVNEDIGSGHLTFAEVLASGQMSPLKSLELPHCELEDGRGEATCNALASQRFASLTSIDWTRNKIGTQAVKALGRAIRSGNLEKLETLCLWSCSINDDDMATLATAFQDGEASLLPNLSVLSLSYNNFTVVGFQSLSEALRSGRLDTLEDLLVWSPSKPSKESANALLTAFALNHCLITDVFFEWYRFPDLGRRYHQLRERNKKNKEILAGLLDCPMVPAAFGKVFLCGSPKVGKTTLSQTLQRGFWKALVTWQTRPHVEKRTRGIEVSQFSSKGTKQITLLVWDMAGQQDYHLVHNAFFPDLSFSEGKATTFAIVCNSEDLDEAEQQLDYWLKYVASSCQKTTPGPRLWHVFVVLNNFGGHRKVHGYAGHWERVLKDQRDKFHGFLNVHTDSFVLDVRRRGEVVGFKTCLLEHSRTLLNDEKVYEICQTIQLNLLGWSEGKKEFPVLDWEEYMQEIHRSSYAWPESIIESATKYLNEAGVLIYIHKEFPVQWGIPYERLVVLDVNWFCKEIVGKIFLSEDMVSQRQHPYLFRKRVAATTGSISISDVKKFFESKWSDKDFEHLITILLWLGLCYKGNKENIFIPSLIDINGKPGSPWQYQNDQDEGPSEDDEEQWVMGFSIEHKESGMTLASMSLWHRFQVALAQTHEFNGEVLDNDFAVGKYFMTFNFDYMHVLIQVNAAENIPTFHEISVFVKPMSGKKDKLNARERKQRQVDLAHHLVEILLRLWDDICGGVEYVRKVVWPWPSSQARLGRPGNRVDRNKEVAEIERSVQMHGIGRKMQWTVGKDSEIAADQLLSTNEKRNVIKSMESDVSILRERMREAVNLRIYPLQLIEDSSVTSSVPAKGIHMATSPTGMSFEGSRAASDGIEEACQPMSPTHRILIAVKEVGDQVREVGDQGKEGRRELFKKLNEIENRLQEGFTKVLTEQQKVFHKLQDTQRFLEEDKDRSCPKLIYLGDKDSGAWATLKQALSPAVCVRLNFACEAKYKNYRPHFVPKQQGLDVSTIRPSLKKIVPWLKVSLTVLSITAKVGANFVAPGAGLLVPNFQEWQQASSLLEGIEWAIGFPKVELDKLMVQGMGLDPNEALWNPGDVYGKSREAITNLIGNLSPQDYEEKLGLRKVCLKYRDGSLHGVVWICKECHRNFRESNLLSEG